jgi:hypothetical protein
MPCCIGGTPVSNTCHWVSSKPGCAHCGSSPWCASHGEAVDVPWVLRGALDAFLRVRQVPYGNGQQDQQKPVQADESAFR